MPSLQFSLEIQTPTILFDVHLFLALFQVCVCVCACVGVCVCVCICVCACVYMYVCVCMCVYVCTLHVYVCVYMYVCVRACVCVYTCALQAMAYTLNSTSYGSLHSTLHETDSPPFFANVYASLGGLKLWKIFMSLFPSTCQKHWDHRHMLLCLVFT